MKNIITIQHTQSIHHTNGMIGSWTDWDISELGISQAENIGKNLAKELSGKNYKMISSDLLRAKHTAEIVAKHLKINYELTNVLRERNLGEAVGKSVEWAHANTIVWEKTIDDKAFKNSESRRDAWNRLTPFLKVIIESKDENVIIVSHGDTLSLFNAMWIGLEVEMLNQCDLFGMSAGVSFLYQNNDGKRIIKRLSDMSFSKLS
ncbi:MAG: phosphoglycerate mutase [Clostridiales bacterium]|nr:phosphoglycerate mutase [Clostridiales bacterium]